MGDFPPLPWNFPHALGLDEPDEPDLVNRIGCTLAAVFRLTVDDVFSIRGRGTVVTGTVELGTIRVGDTVQVNAGPPVRVDGIEAFRKRLDEAQEGQVVGLLLTSLGKHDVNSGDVISG